MDGIEDNVGQLNERLGDVESGEPYAPAIMGETTDVSYSHEVTGEKQIIVYGNTFEHETVKLVNSEQLRVNGWNTNTSSSSGIKYTADQDSLLLNGECVNASSALWVQTSGTGVTIPSELRGKTVKVRFVSDKPCTIPTASSRFRLSIRLRQEGVTGDGREVAVIYADGTDNDYIDASVNINTNADDNLIYVIFRYIPVGAIFDNVRVQVLCCDANASVTDTEETVANGEHKLFSIPSGYTVVDSGLHESALYGVLDTETYIKGNIPEGMVTLPILQQYVPTPKNLTYVSPEMFGAVGDQTTDDTQAIQDCINYAITNRVSVRGYGRYKTMQPLVINAESLDLFINDIDFRGADAAVIVTGQYNYIRFNRLYAYFSTGAGFRLATTQTTHVHYNEIHLGSVYGYTNAVECINNYGNPSTDNKHFYYNKFYMQNLYARTANVVFISGNQQMNENSFWAKHISSPNGYAIYCEGNGGNSDTNRFYEFCIESSCKNGVYGIAMLINCRTAECAGRKNILDGDEGYIFVFDSVLPNGRALNTNVWYTAVDVSKAQTIEDRKELVKSLIESGTGHTLAFDAGFPHIPSFIIGHSPNLMTYMQNAMVGDYTMSGTTFAYYNHKGFIPDYDWYYNVEVSDYYTWETDHCFPTIFDIKANTTIHLDDSYCPIGIKQIKVIQTATEKATIYDHNNKLIFDGTNLSDGVYILRCELLDPEPIVIETSSGTVTKDSRNLRGNYFGDNEQWVVEKLNIVS